VAGGQRAAYLLELWSPTELQHRDQPLVALLVEAALLHTRANLAVVERAADDADCIASAAAQLILRRPHAICCRPSPPAARAGDRARRPSRDVGQAT
jgi:hypothetical protein